MFSFQLFVYNFQLAKRILPLLRHILALPMVGQIGIFQELQPFEIATFGLGHPVKNTTLTYYIFDYLQKEVCRSIPNTFWLYLATGQK